MANGHMEIHDIFENHTGLNSTINCDAKATSDSDDMEDTMEFRILRAYAKRRRPKTPSSTQQTPTLVTSGTDLKKHSPQTEMKDKKKRKKRNRLHIFPKLFSCISHRKSQGRLESPDMSPDLSVCRSFEPSPTIFDNEPMEVEEEVASKLKDIADEIPFTLPEIETDSPEDNNVEKMIGLLLRESGDRLNERELKDSGITPELFLDYNFYKTLITALLLRMGLRSPNPDSPGPKASPKTQIAVTCEVTTRLSALDTLPGNRLMGHGARYMQQFYANWAQQQGGYETAFYSEDEDDIQ
ncbi:hypothetical protein PBY51_008719 [Eleginops maclovinus]|uniref:Apoptosis facilitator Bcl-2-like protein 14 n=1 Tax=Eleginops maclovinus TaxID=56733 RepID=A0AAN8AAQ5_ELEMC|nr:hypothetical protein PBY51_008719 [Eleginops maclovinus]